MLERLIENGIGIALCVIFLTFTGFIYRLIKSKTRTKLNNEEEKIDYLENKFSYLKNIEFNTKTKQITQKGEELKTIKSEFNDVIKIFTDNGFKKGEITEILVSLPYNKKKPWKVYTTLKKRNWLINDKKENIEIFSIYDQNLEALEEYQSFINDAQ